MEKAHCDQNDVIKRLNRAGGHLASVIKMIHEEKPCMAVAQQLHAVICALENAQRHFLEAHIDGCLSKAIEDPEGARQVLSDLRTMTKYLK